MQKKFAQNGASPLGEGFILLLLKTWMFPCILEYKVQVQLQQQILIEHQLSNILIVAI